MPGAALALVLAETARQYDRPVVAVTASATAAITLEQDLAVFSNEVPVLGFPDWETLPYDLVSPHPEIVANRIATLHRLPGMDHGILILPVSTLMQRIAPRHYLVGSGLEVHIGQRFDLDQEQSRLDAAGYRRVSQVGEPGEFAVRGALLDLFPSGSKEPYRIELLDDEVDSLRSFDPETQRSRNTLQSIRFLPAREFPFTEDDRNAFRRRLRERFPIDPRHCPVYQDLRAGLSPAGIEYYLPLFFAMTETLFDYLGKDALFVLGENIAPAAEEFWGHVEDRYEQRAHDIERPILPPAELYLSPQNLRERLNMGQRIELVPDPAGPVADLGLRPVTPRPPPPTRNDNQATALCDWLGEQPGHVLIAVESAGRRETLLERLAGTGQHLRQIANWPEFIQSLDSNTDLAIGIFPLSQGFSYRAADLCVLTESELFSEYVRQDRRRRHGPLRDPATIIQDLSALEDGTPVVHADHGVGRYRGLTTLEIGDTPGEFLAIEYAQEARLYVPITQLDLVSRYAGTDPDLAPLHRLGGDSWEKARRKAAEKIRDVAAELLAIHAQRAARKGTSIPIDTTLYAQFAAGFPFEETPDQMSAIQAVLKDLSSPHPTDRVVCGDVGFGKTEVALRAAFVTAISGRQVAMLVPTTLLAQQHYQTFCDRFADWPLRIEVLSRFRSKKEIEEVLSHLASGVVDLVIGTHRLLQKDIRFARLGLVIVDEEQRFGVHHKERLKKFRGEVDLLTLTATPIPRTLNMALAGMRDLSIIATPPEHRMAIKTMIVPYETAMVREALQRELARGGQVYFLHNQVDTIDQTARELGELMPAARIRIAHGQMPEKELERAMLDFHYQRFNVLVCTTIIESGIDIPSANTIIIDRADRFGLAQLHQLRGRVGRSHHRAYAYLIVPDKRSMTADASKRLKALASLEELGAGFTLATHDLEIRGAGELLGEKQSGQIEAIGFVLYKQLLDRAVQSLKSGQVIDFELHAPHEAEIELHIAALIPDDYLPDVHTRLTLYKRIASAADIEALRELQVEIIDRFGLLPKPLKNLFTISTLKLDATALGIRKLDLGPESGRVHFRENPDIDPRRILRLVQTQPLIYRLDGPEKLHLRGDWQHPEQRLQGARELLVMLGARQAV